MLTAQCGGTGYNPSTPDSETAGIQIPDQPWAA